MFTEKGKPQVTFDHEERWNKTFIFKMHTYSLLFSEKNLRIFDVKSNQNKWFIVIFMNFFYIKIFIIDNFVERIINFIQKLIKHYLFYKTKILFQTTKKWKPLQIKNKIIFSSLGCDCRVALELLIRIKSKASNVIFILNIIQKLSGIWIWKHWKSLMLSDCIINKKTIKQDVSSNNLNKIITSKETNR